MVCQCRCVSRAHAKSAAIAERLLILATFRMLYALGRTPTGKRASMCGCSLVLPSSLWIAKLRACENMGLVVISTWTRSRHHETLCLHGLANPMATKGYKSVSCTAARFDTSSAKGCQAHDHHILQSAQLRKARTRKVLSRTFFCGFCFFTTLLLVSLASAS